MPVPNLYLLFAQGRNRVNARRAPSGDVAGAR
jgi:hypothetical protein